MMKEIVRLSYVPVKERALQRLMEQDSQGTNPIQNVPWNSTGQPPLLTDTDIDEFVSEIKTKNAGMTYSRDDLKAFIVKKKKAKLVKNFHLNRRHHDLQSRRRVVQARDNTSSARRRKQREREQESASSLQCEDVHGHEVQTYGDHARAWHLRSNSNHHHRSQGVRDAKAQEHFGWVDRLCPGGNGVGVGQGGSGGWVLFS